MKWEIDLAELHRVYPPVNQALSSEGKNLTLLDTSKENQIKELQGKLEVMEQLKANPFANYKIRLKKVDRGYLSQEEVTAIAMKKFSTKRLEQVRDIFIFSCFCGLAYIDVKNLRKENIRTSFLKLVNEHSSYETSKMLKT